MTPDAEKQCQHPSDLLNTPKISPNIHPANVKYIQLTARGWSYASEEQMDTPTRIRPI